MKEKLRVKNREIDNSVFLRKWPREREAHSHTKTCSKYVFTETSFITAVVGVLSHWDKILEGNQLEGRKIFFFGSRFQRPQLAVDWFLCLQAYYEAKNSSHSGWRKCLLSCDHEAERHGCFHSKPLQNSTNQSLDESTNVTISFIRSRPGCNDMAGQVKVLAIKPWWSELDPLAAGSQVVEGRDWLLKTDIHTHAVVYCCLNIYYTCISQRINK